VSNKPAVPLSQPLVRGTAGQYPGKLDGKRDSGGTTSLKALAALALRRDSKRDSSGDSGGTKLSHPRKPRGTANVWYQQMEASRLNCAGSADAVTAAEATTEARPTEAGVAVECRESP
jgi:hypothetical protein